MNGMIMNTWISQGRLSSGGKVLYQNTLTSSVVPNPRVAAFQVVIVGPAGGHNVNFPRSLNNYWFINYWPYPSDSPNPLYYDLNPACLGNKTYTCETSNINYGKPLLTGSPLPNDAWEQGAIS